jgi:hypothetical protein
MRAGVASDAMRSMARTLPTVDVPEGHDSQIDLLDAARDLAVANATLVDRVRIALCGKVPCGEPPDLDGLCLSCGRRLAPAVTQHTTGCLAYLPVTAARAARLIVVRRMRLAGALTRFIRGRS